MLEDNSHHGTIVAILNSRITARLLLKSETGYEKKMQKVETGHPVDGEGRRFIECPYYGECLMHAARHNWSTWNCEQCSNLRLDLVCKKLKFISPYYHLLSEIYPEFKTKYEPAIDFFDPEH